MTTRDIQSTVATSQHTVNYDLPLWDGQDITSWQGNLNDAMNKIDTAMYENRTLMLGYQAIADKLEETNSSTVELVNEVNQQLAEINQKYDEVKEQLATAGQKITQAEQAIINLQNEDETVKMQLDTMQDDIGKLMEWHTGINVDLSAIPNSGDDIVGQRGGTFRIIGARFVGSVLSITVSYTPSTNLVPSDYIPNSNGIIMAIMEQLNIVNPVYYGIGVIAVSDDGTRITSEISGFGPSIVTVEKETYLKSGIFNCKAVILQS